MSARTVNLSLPIEHAKTNYSGVDCMAHGFSRLTASASLPRACPRQTL